MAFVVLVIVFLLVCSSYDCTLLIELGSIDCAMGQLADEHMPARVLNIPICVVNADEDASQRSAIEARLARLRPPAMHHVPSVGRSLHPAEERADGGFLSQAAAELGRTLSCLAAVLHVLLDGCDAVLIVEHSPAHPGLAPAGPSASRRWSCSCRPPGPRSSCTTRPTCASHREAVRRGQR
jgi:hypothetical protein